MYVMLVQCNGGVDFSLLQLDGGWQAMPSTYYKIPYHSYFVYNFRKSAIIIYLLIINYPQHVESVATLSYTDQFSET
jgi:hypothetical protein